MAVLRFFNAAFQISGNAELVREVADGADVLAGVELRTADNSPVLVDGILNGTSSRRIRRRLWRVVQILRDPRGNESGSLAGSGVAVRRRSGLRVTWWTLLQASRAGSARTRVQARYLLSVMLREHGLLTALGVVHLALESTGQRGQGVVSVIGWCRRRQRRGHRWILGGDINGSVVELVAQLEAEGIVVEGYAAHGVMAVVWGSRRGDLWGTVHVTHRAYDGSDHHVLTVHERNRPELARD